MARGTLPKGIRWIFVAPIANWLSNLLMKATHSLVAAPALTAFQALADIPTAPAPILISAMGVRNLFDDLSTR